MATVLNPDDELFWRKVREAYDQVNNERNRFISVQEGSRAAIISEAQEDDTIVILIREVVSKPPTLVVP